MSDQDVNIQASGEPQVVNQEQAPAEAQPLEEEQQDTTTLRLVSPFPLHASFTCGDDENKYTITRDGNQVPTDQVDNVLEAARRAGYSMEVQSQ